MGRPTRMNRIVTAEAIEKINPENKMLMEQFLEYLRSVGRSESTITVYRGDLQIVFTYLLEHFQNISFIQMKKRHVVAMQSWMLNELGHSPARVRRVKATMSSMSQFIENILDDEYPDFRNIIPKIENPVLQQTREKSVFTEEELQGLLDTLTAHQKYRDACMLALAMYSGRRKAELVLFKKDFFRPENIIYGSLYKTPEKIKTKGRGNGKFIHCYVLAKQFQPYLDRWLKQMEKEGVESEWLFPKVGRPEEHIGVPTMNNMAARFSGLLSKPFYFHSLRHFFTTEMSRSGIPDSVIQTLVGWDSADMVRIYNDTPPDEELGRFFGDGQAQGVEAKTLSEL